MKELITMNSLELAKGFTFKDARLADATKKITAIYQDAVKYADAKNREIASILSTVKGQKAYEKDGFKSVAEYAEKIFGIKKNSAYALATAGDVYNDAKASPALKAFSPSKLAELSNVDRKGLEDDIKAGKLTPETTQKELREYAKSAGITNDKPVVLDQFIARLVLPLIPDDMAETLSSPRIINDWDEFFMRHIEDKYQPSRPVEIVKLPKANATADSDKKTVNRRLYICDTYSLAVEFYSPKPTKPDKPSKPKYTAEELRAMLAELEKEDSDN